MAALLDIRKLSAFYGASQIIHDLDLTISAGEQIALIGRNGMGKTTLIRSLMGLVPRVQGSVAFNGIEICGVPPEKIAMAGVALVPEGRGIFGSLDVVENLTMAARPNPNGSQHWTLDRVFELFPRLHERRSNGGHQLSGGEQQMLSIGRALMTNPDLILIDEATEGLAPMIAKLIWQTLAKIRQDGIATIVVDKDVKSLAGFVDRFVLLAKGEIVFQGNPAGLMSDSDLLDRHLGV